MNHLYLLSYSYVTVMNKGRSYWERIQVQSEKFIRHITGRPIFVKVEGTSWIPTYDKQYIKSYIVSRRSLKLKSVITENFLQSPWLSSSKLDKYVQ